MTDSFSSDIKYPIGIQTFRDIILNKYLYVDKTGFVYNLVHRYNYVFLSRPRRFGKSLLLSTIQAYFEGRMELFKGLQLERLETEWKTFPVIRFDLSGASYAHPDALLRKLDSYLSDLEDRWQVTATGGLGDRFRRVITNIYRTTGRKVVILIDEYDKPMLDTLLDSTALDMMKRELGGFYAVMKECDEFIRFAMLTGVTKFGKVSLFSGLNNLKDISMMPEYNDICGITEKEFHDYFKRPIEIYALKNGISEEKSWNDFKEFYDGYHFSWPASDLYNPFSVLNAFDENTIGNYWFSSGSSSYLVDLIRNNHFFLPDLEGQRRDKDELSNILEGSDIIPLLYQAGYLSIKDYDPVSGMYTLRLPNREVSKGFWTSLQKFFLFHGRHASEFDTNKFVEDLYNGDVDDFMERLKSLIASVSSEHEPNKELHFQNLITIFVKMLGFSLRTEVHSSYGRSDIEIYTDSFIYIIELKLDGNAGDALSQILSKGYVQQYGIDPRRKVLIGVNFSSRTRTIAEWKYQIIE